jgi:hypothetical protein
MKPIFIKLLLSTDSHYALLYIKTKQKTPVLEAGLLTPFSKISLSDLISVFDTRSNNFPFSYLDWFFNFNF